MPEGWRGCFVVRQDVRVSTRLSTAREGVASAVTYALFAALFLWAAYELWQWLPNVWDYFFNQPGPGD